MLVFLFCFSYFCCPGGSRRNCKCLNTEKKKKKKCENKSQSETLLNGFSINKMFFISMSFEDRCSLYFQRQCSWSTENVHPGFINLCYCSDIRKKLWLRWPSAIRLQVSTSHTEQKSLSPRDSTASTRVPAVRFSLLHGTSHRQVSSRVKAGLTQCPDLCTLRGCACLPLLYCC